VPKTATNAMKKTSRNGGKHGQSDTEKMELELQKYRNDRQNLLALVEQSKAEAEKLAEELAQAKASGGSPSQRMAKLKATDPALQKALREVIRGKLFRWVKFIG